MSVDTVRQDLTDALPDYELIRDCIKGQRAIKAKREKYLPKPDPDDCSDANALRYNDYVERAVFYGVTGRTARGLIGLVFEKDPATELPERLDAVRLDVSGSGVSLNQQAQSALGDVIAIGRAGLFTDYPRTDGPVTAAQAEAGFIRPTVSLYRAEDIINWRVKVVGARAILSLVVLRESYVAEDDGFTAQTATQYRVLRLDDAGVYIQEIWRDAGAGFVIAETYQPRDGAGKLFSEIPFTFVGAEDNEPDIDQPPLLDLAELNKAHYRNSADYEESAYMCGQPTPVFAGLSKQWVEDVFTETRDDGHNSVVKRGAVRIGSRAAVPLPVGGSASLLQAQPNTLCYEAMKHKEQQMIAIGAKLLEAGPSRTTATEATMDNVMDNSALGTVADNVSLAYRACLQWCYQFETGDIINDDMVIDYKLNTDFASRMLTAADRAEIISEWQKGAITWGELRWNLKRTGVAYAGDDEAKEEIAADAQTQRDFEAAAAKALMGNAPDDSGDSA